MYCECEYGDGRLPLLFIVNPAAHSGEGYGLWKQAEAVLQERSIPYEVYFSEKRGDVRQLAKRLTNVSEGAERFLIVLGGDGTLNEAIQGMQHFEQVRLGYIPTGSSNDLARDLKIGHDIRPLMKKLLDGGTEHRMDLGCVTWNADGKTQKGHFLVGCGARFPDEGRVKQTRARQADVSWDRLEADADAAVLQGVDSCGRPGDHQSRKAFICGGNDSPLRGRRLLLLSEGRRSGRAARPVRGQ